MSPDAALALGQRSSRATRGSIRRRLVLLALAAGAIAGVLVYRHYWLARPVGAGPAGPPVARDPLPNRGPRETCFCWAWATA